MPTQSKTKTSTKTRSANGTKASTATRSRKAVASRNQARSAAETALDVPVGAVLGVTERLTDLVEPFTARSGAERQIKAYRTQLRRTLKRTERRGATARRRATAEAKKTRSQAERRVRKAIEAQTSRAQGVVDQVGGQLSALR